MAEELSRTQKYYWKNPEKFREYARKKRAANPEKHKEYTKTHRKNFPDAERERHLKRKFNITISEYDAMLVAQNNVCAICLQPETRIKDGVLYRLAVDHNHITGKIRELLCFKCNSTLGKIETNGISLDAIAAYIKRHKESTDD
jgi:hypothetical protein